MRIELKLFATLAQYLPENSDDFPIEQGETIGSLIERLNLPDDDISLMFVNSVRSNRDTALKDKDRVGLFPPVGGG